MNILTLIPSASTYGCMTLAVLALGSFNIARHSHIQWLKNLSFVGANALVKSLIVFLGIFIIPVTSLFSDKVSHELASIGLGMIGGVLSIWIEVSIIRKINRQRLANTPIKPTALNKEAMTLISVSPKMSLATTPLLKAKGIADIRTNYLHYVEKPDFLNYSVWAVIIVALAEEILFRGYLISIAYDLNSVKMRIAMILISMLTFAFSHLANSWSEFICKLPLSVLTTLNFLITGSLLGPMIIHVLLNLYAYRHVQHLPIAHPLKANKEKYDLALPL